MVDTKISEMSNILGAALKSSDIIPIVDISGLANYKVTRKEFFRYLGDTLKTDAGFTDGDDEIRIPGRVFGGNAWLLSGDRDWET